MSISLYNSCIEELEIPHSKARKIKVISGYLSSLKNFMLILKDPKESIQEILDKLSLVMKLKKVKKHEIILKEGEKGTEFFVLLRGKISVLTPKINDYYMTEEEYISYLFQLRKKDQNELIHKCITLNQSTYAISEDDFDSFVENLSLGKSINISYSKNKNLVKKAKEIFEFISNQKKHIESLNNTGINKKETIISPEEYIIQNSVPDEIIKNTISIYNYLKSLESGGRANTLEDEETSDENKKDEKKDNKELLSNRSKILIPSHEIFGDLETGSYFGEKALEGNGKRHATLIAIEDSYIGSIDKKDYFFIMHYFIENANNKYINFIPNFYIFKNMSLLAWEKKYITFFINKIYDKDYLLLKEGEKIHQMFFTYEGEFELTANKNLIEVNELIINYKKILKKLLNQSNINNKTRKKMLKYCNYNEEVKENDNFIINKRFEGKKFKEMVFDKKTIKLGIVPSKEIIGLLDLYTPIKNNKDNIENKFRIRKYQMISLFNCRCLSCNCEVYTFPLNKFRYICENEDKVGDLSDELQIKKVSNMIKRLNKYKDYLFESMYKDEIENAKEIKIMELKNINKGFKNKFESNKEISNLKFQKGQFIHSEPQKKKKIYHSYDKKNFNSYKNFNQFNLSSIKKFEKNSKQTNSKSISNFEKFKIKQKFLELPPIEDTGKKNENSNNIDTDKKIMNSENRILNNNIDIHKTRILFTKNEKNGNIKLNNIFLENKRINKKTNSEYNFESNNYGSKVSNISNNFINLDNISNLFYKKPLINERNWVAKVLFDNLVYNHIFDKYAFTSFNSYRDSNTTQYNNKNNLKMSLGLIKKNQNNRDKQNRNNFLAKSHDKSLKENNNKNKTQSNIFLKKGNKSLSISNLSKDDKIKGIKLNIYKKDAQTDKNKNGIYDVLIFDEFNKYFNETIYKKFLDE